VLEASITQALPRFHEAFSDEAADLEFLDLLDGGNLWRVAVATPAADRHVRLKSYHYAKGCAGPDGSLMSEQPFIMIVEDTLAPEELAAYQVQDERFQRNTDWLQAHADEIYPRHRDKFICVAGQELFVGDTPEDALMLATSAHSEDNGRFLYYVPKKKLARIYAS
jgi:hypothetical protein